jgi:hypothetical protein
MITILPIKDITYLENIVFENNKFNFKSIDFYRSIPESDIQLFCLKNAFYCLPTLELAEFLKERIGDRKALEIGAGNGYLAKYLDILATDSYIQNDPIMKKFYEMVVQQPIVKYGNNVKKIDGNSAIVKYKPDVTIACWVSQKIEIDRTKNYKDLRVDEEEIIKNTGEYIFIGNENTHKNKTILKLPHETIPIEFVSRNGFEGNIIWSWKK